MGLRSNLRAGKAAVACSFGRGSRVLVAVVAAGLLGALTAASVAATGSGTASPTDCLEQKPVLCFTPQRFRTVYGIKPLLARGIDGRGVTVVIVDGIVSPTDPGTTNIRLDLAAFNHRFHVKTAPFSVVSPFDPSASLDAASPEEVIDVEMVHTVAPGAAIRVVLVPAQTKTYYAGFREGLRYALRRGAVVSMSYSFGEHCFTRLLVASVHKVLRSALNAHVTVVGSSGDYGAVGRFCGSAAAKPVKEVGYFASDPLVLATGGTRVRARPDGGWASEIVWHAPPIPNVRTHSEASGGGFSRFFARPSYQAGVHGISGHRGVPDVAGDASSDTGLTLVKVVGGHPVIDVSSGTSAAAPMWAGLTALADQYAGHRLGFLNAAIYRIARGPHYHPPKRRLPVALHDVTKGNNTVIFGSATIQGYKAKRGWDPVTGWGSPNANVLVPLLARSVKPGDGVGL